MSTAERSGRQVANDAPTLRVMFADVDTAFKLDGPSFSLGRANTNDIHIDSETVSGLHARLVREGETYRSLQLGRTNPTLLRGAPITDAILRHGDRLDIVPGTPNAVTLVFELSFSSIVGALDVTRSFKSHDTIAAGSGRIQLPASGVVTIGRAPTMISCSPV